MTRYMIQHKSFKSLFRIRFKDISGNVWEPSRGNIYKTKEEAELDRPREGVVVTIEIS